MASPTLPLVEPEPCCGPETITNNSGLA
jgi:hypothetical protein